MKHLISGVTAAAALAAWARPAPAQETLFLPDRLELRARDHERIEYSVGILGRLSAIDGEVDPEIPVDYSDLFGAGAGVAFEGALLFTGGYGWAVGPYVSVGIDRYDGRRDTDAFGDSLEADDLEFLTVLAGGKGVFPFAPHWHMEGHLGLGIAHNDRVDGVLTLSGVASDVRVFDSSAVVAFDMGGRIGFRTEQFFGELGIGLRIQGAPEDGDIDFSSSAPAQVALELSAGVRF